ncbi:hypothetical protein ABK040_006850 [Willaertia magna]
MQESISIEDFCEQLNRLKKDYETTSKALSKATKDKEYWNTTFESLTEEIHQRIHPYILQQIDQVAKSDRIKYDLEWKKMAVQRENKLLMEEYRKEEESFKKYYQEVTERQNKIITSLQEGKKSLISTQSFKTELVREVIDKQHEFTKLIEEKKEIIERKGSLESYLEEMLKDLDVANQVLTEKLVRNSGIMQNKKKKEYAPDPQLLQQNHQSNEELKVVTTELRELKQKKQNLLQQVEAKRRLRDAMSDELSSLTEQIQQQKRITNRVSNVNNNTITSTKESPAREKQTSNINVNNNEELNPFSHHFQNSSGNHNNSTTTDFNRFHYKKQNNRPENSPLSPNINNLKRKNNSAIENAEKKSKETNNGVNNNEFQTAFQKLQKTPAKKEESTKKYSFKKTK